MYDYEYEQDALLALRLLKFLHQQDKDALYNLLKEFECSNIEYLVRCAEFSVWEIFSDVIFTTDPEWDTDIATFSHPTIDRFYDLGNRWCAAHGILRSAWRKKVEDTARYFVGGISCEAAELNFTFSVTHITLRIKFSPDGSEPLLFGNAMVDMLLYMEREIQRLEAGMQKADNEGEEESMCRKAAA